MLPKLTVLLAIIPLALAATECTVSNSSPWPFPVNGSGGGDGGGGGDDSVTDTCAQFKNDPTEYKACTDVALSGQCNASGGSGCADSTTGGTDDSGDLISNPGDDLISSGSSSDGDGGLIKMRLRRRAAVTLTCSSSEECYQYVDDSLLCYNLATGAYHDDVGGVGNYLQGTYTAPDQDDSDEESSSSSSSSSSRTASSAAATGGSATASSSRSSAASASAAGASATPASDAGTVQVGALGGVAALVAAFLV